ncbi:MAG: XylR family transcriptional regulator [Kiritimatiellia bacterium]
MSKLNKKVPLIMVLLEMSNKINRDRIQGILRYERLYGPWRLNLFEGKRFEQLVLNPETLGASGIIAVTTLTDVLDSILPTKVPTVFFDSWCPHKSIADKFRKYSAVTCDNETVGRCGAEHLLEKGFCRFAYVEDVWDSPWSSARFDGFTERLSEEGMSCERYSVSSDSARNDWQVDRESLAAWLVELPKPVAVLAASDSRGGQVLDACQYAGIPVPNDVAVLGVDNDELICSTTDPPMSSILRDTEKSGYMAAELLDSIMRRKISKRDLRYYGPASVVERFSTQRMPYADRLAIKAVEFIRINAGIGMSVLDVVNRLGVSRRLAEIRFKEVTGHSIHEEIQMARLSQVKNLLCNTDLSIGAITEQCGYMSESYLGSVFRRYFHMTMREYRRSAVCNI